MKILKTTLISLIVLTPIALVVLLLLDGSFSRIMYSLLHATFFFPVILLCFALASFVKGGWNIVEHKKYRNSMLIGILLVLGAVLVFGYTMNTAWTS